MRFDARRQSVVLVSVLAVLLAGCRASGTVDVRSAEEVAVDLVFVDVSYEQAPCNPHAWGPNFPLETLPGVTPDGRLTCRVRGVTHPARLSRHLTLTAAGEYLSRSGTTRWRSGRTDDCRSATPGSPSTTWISPSPSRAGCSARTVPWTARPCVSWTQGSSPARTVCRPRRWTTPGPPGRSSDRSSGWSPGSRSGWCGRCGAAAGLAPPIRTAARQPASGPAGRPDPRPAGQSDPRSAGRTATRRAGRPIPPQPGTRGTSGRTRDPRGTSVRTSGRVVRTTPAGRPRRTARPAGDGPASRSSAPGG